MICKNCGTKLHPDAKFCSTCGQVQDHTTQLAREIPVEAPHQPVGEVEQSPSLRPEQEPLQPEAAAEQPIATSLQPPPPVTYMPQPVLQPDGSYVYPQQMPPAKRKNIMAIFIAVVIALAVVGSGVFFAYRFLKNSFDAPADANYSPFLLLNNEELQITGVLQDSGKIVEFDEAVIAYFIESSEDGSTMVVSGEKADTMQEMTYVITKDRVTSFEAFFTGGRISNDGSYLYYYSDYDSRKSTMALTQYNTNTEKATEVARNVTVAYEFGMMENTAISPDGKTFAYISGDPEDLDFYLFREGKSEYLRSMVLAISNDGKTGVYFDPSRETLSYESPTEKLVLCNDYMLESFVSGRIYVNPDVTQVLFHDYYNDEYYLYEAGGTPIALKVDGIFPIIHHNTYAANVLSEYYYILDSMPQNSSILPVSDLRSLYFYNYWDSTVLSLDEKNQIQELGEIDGLDQVQVIGDTVFFSSDGTLYKYDRTKDRREKKIANDVEAFVVSDDGSSLYTLRSNLDGKGELHYLSSQDEYANGTRIAKGVIALYTDGKKTCYYISGENNSIYAVQGTGKVNELGSAALLENLLESEYDGSASSISDDAYSAAFVKDGIFYFISEGGKLYSSTDGSNAKHLSDNVYGAGSNWVQAYDGANFERLQDKYKSEWEDSDWDWDDEESQEDWDWENAESSDDWDWDDVEAASDDEAATTIAKDLDICFVFYNREIKDVDIFIVGLPTKLDGVSFNYTTVLLEERTDDIITKDDLAEVISEDPDGVAILDHANEVSLSEDAIITLAGIDYQKTEMDTFALLSDLFLSTFAGEFD